MNMNLNYVKLMKNIFNPQLFSRAAYSQKDKFNPEAFDRLLRELDNTITKYHGKHGLAPIPNWELLTPRGYRFFLPNNVGVGWHDVRTGPYSLRKEFDFMSCDFKCFAQECPLLLRQSVSELFPGANLTYSRLTVLTLSPKNVKQTTENEMEDAVKMFVLTAQEICKKIINEGYWADFINPFSGLPGASTPKVQEKLYETDPRFRGVGFRIFKRQKCLIIDDKKTSQFKGHIFTTAPPQSKRLKQILYFIDYDLDLFESDNVMD